MEKLTKKTKNKENEQIKFYEFTSQSSDFSIKEPLIK